MKLVQLLTPLRITILLGAMSACSAPATEDWVFDVHFVVLLTDEEALAKANGDQLQREVGYLNQYFVAAMGESLPKFRFKSAYYATKDSNPGCPLLVSLGERAQSYDGDLWQESINNCADERVIDPRAITFIVYDSWSSRSQFESITSHGRNNRNRPYIMLDWERLGHNIQSPGEHEMGHAFGLRHICVEGAKRNTPTNIMASAECGKGSGGLRNLGFTPDQVDTILKKAGSIADTIGTSSVND